MAKILLADDNPTLLAVIGRVLRTKGYGVTSTSVAADALCLLKSADPKPDLVILDLGMPLAEGKSLVQHANESWPPVIVITGGDGSKVPVTGGTVRRVLTKPFEYEDLIEAVCSVLNDSECPGSCESCPVTHVGEDEPCHPGMEYKHPHQSGGSP